MQYLLQQKQHVNHHRGTWEPVDFIKCFNIDIIRILVLKWYKRTKCNERCGLCIQRKKLSHFKQPSGPFKYWFLGLRGARECTMMSVSVPMCFGMKADRFQPLRDAPECTLMPLCVSNYFGTYEIYSPKKNKKNLPTFGAC